MPNRKLAVEVAKDVLKLLKRTRHYSVLKGHGYVCNFDSEQESAQQALKDKTTLENCEVCAKGAALISYIRLKNKIKTRDLAEQSGYLAHRISAKLLGDEEANDMESEFESCSNHEEGETTLKAIMKNIIKNKGHFIPG